MLLDDAIQYALDGRAILFLGAGFNYGASNTLGDPLPAGAQLTALLLEEIGLNDPGATLDQASNAYLRRRAPGELVAFLKRTLSAKGFTDSHRTIATVPWRRIYTTNYDDTFYKAAFDVGNMLTPVSAYLNPRDHLNTSSPILLHINGRLDALTAEQLATTFKLTSRSYAADSFEKSGWALHFRQDVRAAAAIVFVGYSLYDLDIRRILLGESVEHKTLFVVKPASQDDRDSLQTEELEEFGSVFEIGVDGFSKEIVTMAEHYLPVKEELILQHWVSKTSEPIFSTETPPDQDVIDYLVEGRMTALLSRHLSGRSSAFFSWRDAADASLLRSAGKRYVVIYGDLGTGKTHVAMSIARDAADEGYSVFWLEGEGTRSVAELEKICSTGGRLFLVIENFNRHMPLLRWISERTLDRSLVLLTARTTSFELHAEDLDEVLGEDYYALDVTVLSGAEIRELAKFFDSYGLWGERMSWSPRRKVQYLEKDCSSTMPVALVDLMKSKHISEKYREAIDKSLHSSDAKRILIAVFCLEVAGFVPRAYWVRELLGSSVDWYRMSKVPELRSFIDVRGSEVYVRSSVLARHLLAHVFAPVEILQTLIEMVRAAEAKRSDDQFWEIYKTLTRFSSLVAILPERDFRPSTINFYENTKNLGAARRNPLFWLQYGIACLTLKLLDRAETYFKDAYGFAYEGFDTRQIDNHMARLLLEKASIASSWANALPLVDQARSILLRQMKGERRYYPYRAARGFFAVFDRFEGSLGEDGRRFFKGLFEDVKWRAEATSGTLRKNRYVEECIAQADASLRRLT